MMKRRWIPALAALLFSAGFAADKIWVPVLEGDWWRIAPKTPDVSPFNQPRHDACDFSIWQATDGTWLAASCIRETSYPGFTRLFHRWETENLTDVSWKPSVFTNTFETTNGAVTVTNGIFAVSNPEINQYDGVMQAPHCVKEDGKYYLYYNAAFRDSKGKRSGNFAFCKVSEDGKNFTDLKAPAGDYRFFSMGRDLMIFRDDDGTYYSYFAKNDEMQYRTAKALEGPWSSEMKSLGTSGNPESPFVVKYGDAYYLWEQMQVFYSETCDSFPEEPITKMTPGWFHGKWAPEILLHEGQYYIFGYNDGLWGCKMKWVEKTWDEIDAWRAEKSYVRPPRP